MAKIAVVGFGSVGRLHARNLVNHGSAALAGICDVVPDAARDFCDTVGAVFTTQFADIIEMRPDAVIVSSSTTSHGDILRACIAAEIPFLCEKPVSRNLEDAEDIARLVSRSGLISATALNRRFDKQYAALRDAVRAGQIGKPEILCFTSRSIAAPTVAFSASSGGLFAEKGSHFYDLARWISGDEPVEISAMGAVLVDDNYHSIGEHDTAVISMKLKGGALCRFDFSWRTTYGQDERIEIHGSNGLISTAQAKVGATVHDQGHITHSPDILPTWQERFSKSYQRELDAFLSVLVGGDTHPVLASVNDGLLAQRIAVAARASATTGRPVTLN